MRHPFDGLNQPVTPDLQPESSPAEAGPEGLTRRSALEKMVFAAAGFVAVPAVVQAQIAVTNALNEQGGAPPVATTLALGEEAATAALRETGVGVAPVTTEPFGEEAGKVTSRAAPGVEDGAAPAPATRAANEAGGPITRALNENGGGVTTQAVGEEGGATTKAVNEEGAATQAINEAGGPLTRARGEEGTGPVVSVKPDATELPAKQMEAAWTELANKDAAKAVQACAILYGAKGAVPFLKEHLKVKFPPFDEQRAAQAITDLDADAFAVREKAERDLAAMGPAALPALRKALAQTRSSEVRMRIQRLLDSSKDQPVLLQAQRGLEVLVALQTPEARKLIEEMAQGDEKEWLTQAAKEARARLTK